MPMLVREPRLQLLRHPWQPTKSRQYSEALCRLCHTRAELRLPDIPPSCPQCDLVDAEFFGIMIYASYAPGWWNLKCKLCGHTWRPLDQSGPVDGIKQQIEKQIGFDAQQALTRGKRQEKQLSRRDTAKPMATPTSEMANSGPHRHAKGQDDALASLDRLRKDVYRAQEELAQHVQGASTVARHIQSQSVRLRIIAWRKRFHPSVKHRMTVDLQEGCKLWEHSAFKKLQDDYGMKASFWDPIYNCWEPINDAIPIACETTTLLVRENFDGHCLGLGTELHLLQDVKDPKDGKITLAPAKCAREEVLSREIDDDHLWVVVWYADNVNTRAERVPFPSSGNLELKDVGMLRDLLPGQDCLEVWFDDGSRWKQWSVKKDHWVLPMTHTILARASEVCEMPFLGVEIEALRTPRPTVRKSAVLQPGAVCSSPLAQSTNAEQPGSHILAKIDAELAYLKRKRSRSPSLSPLGDKHAKRRRVNGTDEAGSGDNGQWEFDFSTWLDL